MYYGSIPWYLAFLHNLLVYTSLEIREYNPKIRLNATYSKWIFQSGACQEIGLMFATATYLVHAHLLNLLVTVIAKE
jgi:hypothetical protein